jgi:hypothetical protein
VIRPGACSSRNPREACAPSSLSKSVSAAMLSIIAPLCFEAMRRRSARSRTARFDRSPVSGRARSISSGSRSTLVTAMMGSSRYMGRTGRNVGD